MTRVDPLDARSYVGPLPTMPRPNSITVPTPDRDVRRVLTPCARCRTSEGAVAEPSLAAWLCIDCWHAYLVAESPLGAREFLGGAR